MSCLCRWSPAGRSTPEAGGQPPPPPRSFGGRENLNAVGAVSLHLGSLAKEIRKDEGGDQPEDEDDEDDEIHDEY